MFALDEMTDCECLAEFRFKKRDISLIAEVLGVPETIQCEQGSTCDGMEGLCMLLRRLSFPCRYGDSQICEACPYDQYGDEHCVRFYI